MVIFVDAVIGEWRWRQLKTGESWSRGTTSIQRLGRQVQSRPHRRSRIDGQSRQGGIFTSKELVVNSRGGSTWWERIRGSRV